MPTPHFRSQLAAALLGLLGTAFLVNSLSVHPQDKGDKASATQSKESSSGSSSGASTTQGGAAGAGGMNTVGASKLSQSDERMVKQIAEASFGCTVTGDTVVLPGIMSRKKQIIPALKL